MIRIQAKNGIRIISVPTKDVKNNEMVLEECKNLGPFRIRISQKSGVWVNEYLVTVQPT